MLFLGLFTGVSVECHDHHFIGSTGASIGSDSESRASGEVCDGRAEGNALTN